MNAFSTIDIDALPLAPEVSLATVETLTPAIVFVPGGVEKIISKLEADVRAIERDISTAAGREAVKSLAYKVARSKTALDEMGKETVAGIKKQAGLIDADRRIIRDRLDALRDEVRAPVTAYEEAEQARVDAHENALVFMIESPRFAATIPSANAIEQRIAAVEEIALRDWQEFDERAESAGADALAILRPMLAAAVQAEADAAELAMLRRQRVEREEADRAAEIERQRQIAAQEATARQAIREQQEAEAAAERHRQNQEQAKRNAEAAAARAVEDERKRVADAQAAEKAAAEKRAANVRRRAKVHTEIRAALTCDDIAPHIVDRLIDALAAGEIPHVSITY